MSVLYLQASALLFEINQDFYRPIKPKMLELGCGITIFNEFGYWHNPVLTARIGVRYQPIKGGTVYRLAFVPFIGLTGDNFFFAPIVPSVGVSYGYSF